MFVILLYLLLCCLVAAFANKSGRNFVLWLVVSLFISPIFSGILLLIMWLLNGNIIYTEPEQINIGQEIKKMADSNDEAIKIMEEYIDGSLEKYKLYTEHFNLIDKNECIVKRATQAKYDSINSNKHSIESYHDRIQW